MSSSVEKICEAKPEGARSTPDPVDSLGNELRNAMVTICAVAFSIEALTREVAPLAVPDETRAAWRRNGTKADAMAIEILKRSVTLPHSEIEALRGALAMVVEARGTLCTSRVKITLPSPTPPVSSLHATP